MGHHVKVKVQKANTYTHLKGSFTCLQGTMIQETFDPFESLSCLLTEDNYHLFSCKHQKANLGLAACMGGISLNH